MKKLFKFLGALVLIMQASIFNMLDAAPDHRWVWVYRKTLSESDHAHLKKKQTLMFVKENIPVFSQLIFSWNAQRPACGHFSYYVQARNAKTKRWGTWHHMMDWGSGKQRSYASKSADGFTQYVHVRLQVSGPKADAFRIKIAAKNGAPIENIKGFAVTTAQFSRFKPEAYDTRIKQLASVHIPQVPKLSQFMVDHTDKYRICSPTSCTMLARYLSKKKIDPVDFAQQVFDQGLQVYGSWAFNAAHAFEQCDQKAWFFATRLNSFVELYKQLSRQVPIVVSVRGSLPGAAKPYQDGHLMVVVGWDAQKKEIICHDPAFKSHKRVVRRYPFANFIRAWEMSHRLVYFAEPI